MAQCGIFFLHFLTCDRPDLHPVEVFSGECVGLATSMASGGRWSAHNCVLSSLYIIEVRVFYRSRLDFVVVLV